MKLARQFGVPDREKCERIRNGLLHPVKMAEERILVSVRKRRILRSWKIPILVCSA